MVIQLPKCCKGYFGRDCQGEGASYQLIVLKGWTINAAFQSTGIMKRGSGRGCTTPKDCLKKDPKAVILKSCVALLLFDFCHIFLKS